MEALSPALISPIAISLACILVVTLSWSVLKWVWFNPKRFERILREQGFQGNPYRILYGDSKDKARMTAEDRSKPMSDLSNDHLPRTQPFYHHTVKNHGKRCFMWNGPIPMVNITEPEAMREIFTKLNEFQKPKINPILNVVATGLIQLEGDIWAIHRKLLNPAFHMEKLKFMLPAFSASTTEMINTWEEMVSESGSCEIDVWSHLHKLSADVISRAAFGSSYEEGRRIFELITEQLKVAVPIINQVYIPGWRLVFIHYYNTAFSNVCPKKTVIVCSWYVPTKVNRRIIQLDREIKSLLKEIIKNREEAIKAGAKPRDDLLGALLESNTNKNQKISITLEEVIDECKIFFLAGQETTSTLLAWTLILLGKHQDWQLRAREEVLNAFGDNTPDFHGLNQLKMVNMILQEVLRLYPPVLELNRTVCKDIKVGDIFLPAGVLVNLPLLHVQHDESIWGSDAKEFKPDRFSQGMSKATNGNMSFFAFGWGPRICIGSNFAMTEAKLVLVLILQRFSFEISPSYAHAPTAIGTLRPQFGAPIILKRLSN